MSMEQGAERRVIGGVDTHKDLHVAAVVDERDRVLATASFATTRQGYRKMLVWMRSFGAVQRIGVESTGSYGAGLLRFLQQAGIEVLEVTAPDAHDRRRRGKNDDLDAQSAAHAAFAGPGLAVLVNNVGNYLHRPLLETTDADWAEMLGSNLLSTVATCQEAAPLMAAAGYGRIVNLGYAGARDLKARPGITPYVIAKAGVLNFSRALATTLAGSGVSVNVVSPGILETSVAQPLRAVPAGRSGTVAELVDAALYFVRASDYVTGQELEVAGGWNL